MLAEGEGSGTRRVTWNSRYICRLKPALAALRVEHLLGSCRWSCWPLGGG